MTAKFEYILFDVAGTLLHKPKLYETIYNVLSDNGFKVDLREIKEKHKIVSEIVHFPDRTNQDFYNSFNATYLLSLGIIPTTELLAALFSRCSYLPWEKYEDCDILGELGLPMGIISNFNTTLKAKLAEFFDFGFKNILVSEEIGVAKPSLDFYKRAVDEIGIAKEKIIYIGDSLKLDIVPALDSGIQAYLIDREGYYLKSEHRVGSLHDLKSIIYG